MVSSSQSGQANGSKIKTAVGFFLGLLLIFLIYLFILENIPLTREDGETLIKISDATMKGETYYQGLSPRLSKEKPVFVSVYQNGTLIACVGYTKPLFPLYESVRLLSRDIDLADLDGDELVITVIGGYQNLDAEGEIPKGSGVLVRKNGFDGVVLPIPIEEEGLTRDEALLLAAQKAGFSNFSWTEFETYTFDAQIFRGRAY